MKTKYVLVVVALVLVVGGYWVFSERIVSLPPSNGTPPDGAAEQANIPDLITVATPLPNEVVGSPITVSGAARGYWFFEGSFPVVVTDWNGLIIGEGYAEAQSEWMTEEYVPFVGMVSYDLPHDTPYKRGTVILMKANPSGLPENDNAIEFQITF